MKETSSKSMCALSRRVAAMSEAAGPTEKDLELVAKHGSNDLTRALATVELADRRGELGELRESLEE